MEWAITFAVAFAFSFTGSIPPGTLNLTVVQMGLQNQIAQALRFSFAAAAMEYPYAWLAISFEKLITSSPELTGHMQLVAGLAMLVFGFLNMISASKPKDQSVPKHGFTKGLVMGILNPLAVPFWVAVTAYLKSLNVVQLDSQLSIHLYLSGVFLGAFALLVLVALLAKKAATILRTDGVVKKVPGLILIILGVYALVNNSL